MHDRGAVDDGPLDIHDNACGIAAANPHDVTLQLTDATVRDNGSGVSAGKIKGSNVVLTGNGSGGIQARSSIVLKGCTVQVLAPPSFPDAGSPTWGVCAGD